MRTRTILAQFGGLRAFDWQSMFTGRMDKWWKMLVEGRGPQPLVTVRMNLIDSPFPTATIAYVNLTSPIIPWQPCSRSSWFSVIVCTSSRTNLGQCHRLVYRWLEYPPLTLYQVSRFNCLNSKANFPTVRVLSDSLSIASRSR